MRFRIKDEVFARFPTVCIGLVVASEVRNSGQSAAVAALLRRAEVETRHRFAAHGIRDERAFRPWRQAFQQLGLSPSRFKASVEALAARVAKGDDLPELNPVVDLANAVSLLHLVPVGAHDLEHLRGDVAVGPVAPGLLFTPLGHLAQEAVDEGEYVYADGQEVHTRRWVWRQSDRTKVTASSRRILLPIDGWTDATDVAVRTAQGDLVGYLQRELGAHTQTFFLDREHPEVVLLEPGDPPGDAQAGAEGFRTAGFGYLERREPAIVAAPGAAGEDPAPVSGLQPAGARGPDRDDDAIGALLRRATLEVVGREELEVRLRRGDRLRVKFGIDPTGPHIHLGHAVALRKLRAFQELGHTVCLVIGDFTAQVGDPSAGAALRQPLSEEQAYANLAGYRKVLSRVLDPHRVEWSYNNDWLGPLRFRDVAGLATQFTLAQLLEQHGFSGRLTAGTPIGLQECLYPLMQGYDSVVLKADVEIGGADQSFNMQAGRTLQRAYGQPPQAIMILESLPGTDGRPMSQSLDNTINLDDPPREMYGKAMSIPDQQIAPYFELCTDLPPDEVRSIAEDLHQGGGDPLQHKKRLALEIARLYHGASAAQRARDEFERVAQRRGPQSEIAEVLLDHGDEWPLADLLCRLELAASKTSARQKALEGAVEIDGVRITDIHAAIVPRAGMVVRLGRRYARIRLPT